MRFITAVAILVICQGAYGQATTRTAKGLPAVLNNVGGSIITKINNDLAWIAPFGRRLREEGELPLSGPGRSLLDIDDAIQQNSIVKGNAIGSIFYDTGFANPAIVQAAITGIPPGRKLSQVAPNGPDKNPDPYGFIPAANVAASILTGNYGHDTLGRKLSEEEEVELVWDTEAVNTGLGIGRKLQQDQLAANYLGSLVYGVVETANTAAGKTGRKLMQPTVDASVDASGKPVDVSVSFSPNPTATIEFSPQPYLPDLPIDYSPKPDIVVALPPATPLPSIIDPERTGYLGTGKKSVMDNALGSIHDDPSLLHDPLVVRQGFLGFQNKNNRRRLDQIFGHPKPMTVKENAAASIHEGGITYDNIHKVILGFQQTENKRK